MTGVSVGLICAVATPFLMPAFRRICLPYVPATDSQVKNVMAALKTRKGTLIDLGSGDGRIVIEASRNDFVAEGVELNPWLVYYSKLKSYFTGTSNRAKFRTGNLWKQNLSKYDNVVIFGVDSMMEPLQTKLKNELKSDSLVVTCRYPFSSKYFPTSVIGEGIDTVWTYKKSDLFADSSK